MVDRYWSEHLDRYVTAPDYDDDTARWQRRQEAILRSEGAPAPDAVTEDVRTRGAPTMGQTYVFTRIDKSTGEAEPVTREEVERTLGGYYHDPFACLRVMSHGGDVDTPFAIYRMTHPSG